MKKLNSPYLSGIYESVINEIMNNRKQLTDKQLQEENRKCWSTGCKKTGWISIFGWNYCLRHWIRDIKYGTEVGFTEGRKLSDFMFSKLIRNIFK